MDIQESDAYHHRARKAWGTFFKWKDTLRCKSVDIGTRLDFWNKTVAASLTWGLETTRASCKCAQIAVRTQRHMIACMLQRHRQPVDEMGNYSPEGVLETFVQHKIRVNREIKTILSQVRPNLEVGKMIRNKKRSFAGHISRFGMQNREEHIVKHIVLWRNAFWWHYQRRQILKGFSSFTHPRVGKIARWELQFPRNWITEFFKEEVEG